MKFVKSLSKITRLLTDLSFKQYHGIIIVIAIIMIIILSIIIIIIIIIMIIIISISEAFDL